MTVDDTRERRRIDAAGPRRRSEAAAPDRPAPVLAAYDVVKGTDAFIVADADRDDAWIAVAVGGERDLAEWR